MKFLRSLSYALSGVCHALGTQAHMRFHGLAALVVIVLGLWLQVPTLEWALLVLAMGLVLSAEGMNTAVELLADRITKERDPLIGAAKDVAAGAVLLAVCAAVAVGLLVLGPRLWLIL